MAWWSPWRRRRRENRPEQEHAHRLIFVSSGCGFQLFANGRSSPDLRSAWARQRIAIASSAGSSAEPVAILECITGPLPFGRLRRASAVRHRGPDRGLPRRRRCPPRADAAPTRSARSQQATGILLVLASTIAFAIGLLHQRGPYVVQARAIGPELTGILNKLDVAPPKTILAVG